MFCASCGSAISNGDKFCANCGATYQGSSASPIPLAQNPAGATVGMLRHPKEEVYFTIGMTVSVIVWLLLVVILVIPAIIFAPIAIPVIISLWVAGQVFKARVLGGAVKVGPEQYPEIYELADRYSKRIGLSAPPDMYVINENGLINAYAIKFLSDQYIMLYANLVDVMLAHDSSTELGFVIGHEIGHHAAGHTSWWKRLLLKPAMFLPFFGPAYSRSCELTGDRIGMYLCGDKDAACRSLITIACGSRILSPKTNLVAFANQEALLSPLFAFLHDLFSTHPRITRRVIELQQAAHLIGR